MAAESKQYTVEQENKIIAIAKVLLPMITEGECSFESIVTNTDHYREPNNVWGLRCEGGNLYPISELLGDRSIFFEQIIHWAEYEFERVDNKQVKRLIPLIPANELHWMFEEEKFVKWRSDKYKETGKIYSILGYVTKRIKELFGIII